MYKHISEIAPNFVTPVRVVNEFTLEWNRPIESETLICPECVVDKCKQLKYANKCYKEWRILRSESLVMVVVAVAVYMVIVVVVVVLVVAVPLSVALFVIDFYS